MRPFKIFIFAYWHDKGWKGFVGATVKIWDFAHNMARLGHHVVLLLPEYEFPQKSLPLQLIQVPFLDFALLRSLSFNFFLTIFLVVHHIASKPDVVYIRRGISIVPAIYAKLKKTLLIYEVNDDPYRYNRAHMAGPVSLFAKWLSIKTDEIILSWCDAAFVITKEIKDKLIQRLPHINPEKIRILPSGANTDLYRPMDQIQCRLRLNLENSKKYIGFMGTLLEHQGVDVLVDAAPSVLQSIPDAFFVIIGEGPMKDQWRRRVDERSLQGHFLFTGQIDYEQTPLWINAMDLCVAPFLLKVGLSSPVKIFDYMACGKPVVASKIPGTTEIFDGSDGVRLIEPENKDALADALVDILADEEKAKRMGMQGRRLVETHYDRRVLAEKVQKEVYGLLKAQGG